MLLTSIPSGSNMREIESLMITEASGQLVAMKDANTHQVFERAGGVSRQLDENQLQPMEVSLDRCATTGVTKHRAETHLTTNYFDCCIDGWKRFDVQQAEQADLMLPI